MTREGSAPILPAETRIERTALTVADRASMAEFYRDVIGLERLDETADTTMLGVGSRTLLQLSDSQTPTTGAETGTGLYHNAFRVPTRSALGDALRRCRDRWELDGASDHGVSEALYLTDPEGNGVEIYRDHPRSEWPTDGDGRVQLDTAPLDLAELSAAASGDTQLRSGTDIGHVHLAVSSLSAAEDWYVDTLGFTVQTRLPEALFVSAGGYHHQLGLNTWERRSGPPSGLGSAWFEIVVPSTSALEAVRNRLADRSEPVDDMDAGIAVTDPDGIKVRVRPATTR